MIRSTLDIIVGIILTYLALFVMFWIMVMASSMTFVNPVSYFTPINYEYDEGLRGLFWIRMWHILVSVIVGTIIGIVYDIIPRRKRVKG